MTHRVENHEPIPGAVLAAEGVHAGYAGHPDVLDCVSLGVTPGRRLAILGANGSGKTTLLRCLSGAHRPSEGTVRAHGDALRHTASGLATHRQRVQLVLQDPDDQLFSAEVFEDVAFGPVNLGLSEQEVRARVEESLAVLGLSELAERPIHHLSFGQRKRVAIAGALAMRPSVLLLDEPTAGLDPQAVAEMRAALRALEERGTTVVLSTHDVDLAWQWADEVAVFDRGYVHQGLVGKLLADEMLLASARLGLPWAVALLRGLGHEIDPQRPPRTVDDVGTLLRGGR